MKPLIISRAASRAGVSIETIRFYERKGLINQPPKPVSGYRTYPAETVCRIKFIRQAQELGFSLREIDELLALKAAPGTDCSDVRNRATAKLHEVDTKIEQLQGIRVALRELISVCPGRGALRACTIMESLASVEGDKEGQSSTTQKENTK